MSDPMDSSTFETVPKMEKSVAEQKKNTSLFQELERLSRGTVRPMNPNAPFESADPDAHQINPPHYMQGKIEVIDFIEDHKLNYHLGNVIKYLCRAPYKGTEITDLKKARWYLDRYIIQKEKDAAENR